jgi:hypothetical protein
MPRPHYALTAMLLLAAVPVWGQIALAPQAGLLVLKNGQILEGEITAAGDYYVLTHGDSAEIRLRTAEVEAVCASLDEAYEFKLRHLSGKGAASHLDLAEWCLRHGLTGRSAEQVVAATRLEPEHPRLVPIQRRLELAVNAPASVAQQATATAATVGIQQLEKTLNELPAGSVEKFAAVVQPILLNRCGAGQCHGPGTKAEYRLLKPPVGQLVSRRFTQRNLYATLAWLDRSDPAASKLLTLTQRRHGTALTPVFDKHSAKQFAELEAWAKLTTAAVQRPPSAPPTIPRGQTAISQSLATPAGSSEAEPSGSQATDDSQRPQAPAISSDSIEVRRPSLEATSAPTDQGAAASERFVPRDRYDADLFNRRFQQQP